MPNPDPVLLQRIVHLEGEIRKEKLAIAAKEPAIGSFAAGAPGLPISHHDRLAQLEEHLAELRLQMPAEDLP